MLDEGAPVFAAPVGMRSEVARAVFAVVIEFLGVFEQKRRAQIGSFGAIKPADCFVASFVWQFFVEFVRLFAQIFQVLRYGIVSRHVFQLGNGFV
ncbi:hypothetical protein NM2001072_2109 [Neisseria meningitidis 2001072]|nr:hypothetical protein NM2001072_2109 [Neisseria meningitidis 2001072]